jgi:hypothetical protein
MLPAPPCCDDDEDSDEDSDEDQRTEDDDEACCEDKEAHKHLPVDVVVRTKQQTTKKTWFARDSCAAYGVRVRNFGIALLAHPTWPTPPCPSPRSPLSYPANRADNYQY